jgi:hypothetical protein
VRWIAQPFRPPRVTQSGIPHAGEEPLWVEPGRGRENLEWAILVVAACPGEGPFAIRLPTLVMAYYRPELLPGKPPLGKLDGGKGDEMGQGVARFSNSSARR